MFQLVDAAEAVTKSLKLKLKADTLQVLWYRFDELPDSTMNNQWQRGRYIYKILSPDCGVVGGSGDVGANHPM